MYDFVDYLNVTGRNFYDGAYAAELVGESFVTYLKVQTFTRWNLGLSYNTGMVISDDGVVEYAFVGANSTLPIRATTLRARTSLPPQYQSVWERHSVVNAEDANVHFYNGNRQSERRLLASQARFNEFRAAPLRVQNY